MESGVKVDWVRSALRRSLGCPNVSRKVAFQAARQISSLTWRQVEVLEVWARVGFNEVNAARELGVSPSDVCQVLAAARRRLYGSG